MLCCAGESSDEEVEQAPVMLGGYGAPQAGAVTPEVYAMTQSLKGDIEAKVGARYSTFEPVECSTQVVNGTNYKVKINCGHEYVNATIYKPIGGSPSVTDASRG
mmetsp:Transcript_60653/g.112510  ORF Transcript_60653/g.112510 Transcript_60653/m.112510 type:complete len:104 (-) Transcript_60653:54-365(-)